MARTLGGLVVAAIALGGVGCATVVSGGGGPQKVTVVSDPPDAAVSVDGRFVGNSPVKVPLERRASHTVEITAAGYETAKLEVTSKFNPWVIGNVVFGGLVGVVVDVVTDATYRLSPDELTVQLRPTAALPSGSARSALPTPSPAGGAAPQPATSPPPAGGRGGVTGSCGGFSPKPDGPTPLPRDAGERSAPGAKRRGRVRGSSAAGGGYNPPMPDRESFVAAIAAAPEDDLPRLVFADWLDEHGEPERAEFIRAQCVWMSSQDYDEREKLGSRAAELVRENWQHWFGPLLQSLNGSPDTDRKYAVDISHTAGMSVQVRLKPLVSHLPVRELFVQRGFVRVLHLDTSVPSGSHSFEEAFRTECPAVLSVSLGDDPQHWLRWTEPALRRLTELHLWEVRAENDTGPHRGVPAVFDDPHLAGVRSLCWYAATSHSLMYALAVPAASIRSNDHRRSFVHSPLAYRLNELMFSALDEDGVRALSRSDRLHLTKLDFQAGPGTPAMGRLLAEAGFAPTLEALRVNEGLPDAAVVQLASGTRWHRLKELDLSLNRLSAAVLAPLAAAGFTPYLEKLDLSDNPLFDGDDDLDGLRELAAALSPDRLQLLRLTLTGLTAVPDFLANRFGDRVLV